ncbi:hypothetical protein [Helcococcus sueciensis]|uniref:hypothetical protein n=1 Tax=Helcococcus sueciensis TaxID=241555 RepID=UPI00041FC597|nr:hypothetical protein [Helcococcus sueciensis]
MQRRKLNQENKDNKKKLFILLGVLALLVVVGSVIAIKNRNNKQVEETPKETVLETVKESEKETQKESSKKENKKEDKKDKKVTQKKDDNKKVKEEVKEDGTVVIESEDEKGNKVVTKIKDNKVEKIVTDKTGKTKTERSNINDKENSGLKTKVKEVVKEKSVASKPSTPKQNTKTEKPKENKVTKPSPSKPSKPSTPSKPKETKKEVVRTTETQSISFNTIDNYAYTGGKSRVYQEGRSGVKTIVKEDGKVVSNTITTQPQDKIIERYVKVQSAEYKTVEKEVDNLDRPIYNEYGRERWFVHNDLTGETKYFYSAGEAEDYMLNNAILGNWGTAETEIVVTDEIVGYETKIVKEEVKVSDEVWEWKH